MRRILLLLALPVFLTACPQPQQPPAAATPAPAPVAAAPAAATETPAAAAEAPIYALQCGCAIKEVGHCGEYAMLPDGKHIEIVGDLGLGSMPFCKKDGLKAKIGGEVKDDKLAFTSFELLK